MTREYSRIFFKVILASKQSWKVNFWSQNWFLDVSSPYFGPQCLQCIKTMPYFGPQCLQCIRTIPYFGPQCIQCIRTIPYFGPQCLQCIRTIPYYWTSMPPMYQNYSIFWTSMPPMPENYSILLDLNASNASELFHILDLGGRRRRRRRRRRFPKNSGIWAEPWSNVPRNQISRAGNPSLR